MAYKPELYSEAAKAERFKRVAERRINKILNDLRLLGNTANKQLYLYSDADIDKIFMVIENKVAEIRGRFNRKSEEKFKL